MTDYVPPRKKNKQAQKYVTPKEASQILAVCLHTLRRWEQTGKIRSIRTAAGHRRYDINSYFPTESKARQTIVYARVSSRGQKNDLDRQIAVLAERFPDAEIISEIGSGLNFRRKKLLAILERVMRGDVATIVVAHKDRLARFGFELIQWLCQQNDCQLLVLDQDNLSPEREMVEDILAIIHCFSCRLYGLRKYRKKDQEVQNCTQE